MNTSALTMQRIAPLAVAAVISAVLVACASAPRTVPAAAAVRERLNSLQQDATLAGKADVAMQDAESAVRTAEIPQGDKALSAHRVFLADRKVESARAIAEMRVAEEQQGELGDQRERARLDARTREADAASARARSAQVEGDTQRRAADAARTEADALQEQAGELRQQISDLQAQVTERGIVMTVGDMLFISGKASLLTGTTGNLDKLATFLDGHPQRTVRIEGHTDSTGTSEANYQLSQRRAESVKSYLVGRGVGSARLTTAGIGEDVPVGDNASPLGRQVNRRVEVIISNEMPASQ